MLILMVVLFGNTSSRKLEMSEKQQELLTCMVQLVNVEGLVAQLDYMIAIKTELLLGSVQIVDIYGREHEFIR
jgi:hypothetical protein